MKDLDEFEIKNNPFEDFKSLDSFKNLKSIQLDNPKALKSHLKPTSGPRLQGKWISNCSYSEIEKLYEIKVDHFTSKAHRIIKHFKDKECSEKVMDLELTGNFNLGLEKENYRELNLSFHHLKKTEFKVEGKKTTEHSISLSLYDIFKVEGDKLTVGETQDVFNNERILRPKTLGKLYLKVSK
jgi:hypothetical protein